MTENHGLVSHDRIGRATPLKPFHKETAHRVEAHHTLAQVR